MKPVFVECGPKAPDSHAREMLAKLIPTAATVVYSLYQKPNETGRWIRVFVIGVWGGSTAPEIIDVTGYVATACGRRVKVTPNEKWVWVGGSGHSHAQAICEDLSRVLGFQPAYKVL